MEQTRTTTEGFWLMKKEAYWIIELEKGVWVAPWKGDPGRTLNKEMARKFWRWQDAKTGLTLARKYRPFEHSRILRGECGAR